MVGEGTDMPDSRQSCSGSLSAPNGAEQQPAWIRLPIFQQHFVMIFVPNMDQKVKVTNISMCVVRLVYKEEK